MIKNNTGAAFLPYYSFNGVGDLETGQGYQLKLVEPAVVSIAGGLADPLTAIAVAQGWNLIGYLPKCFMDPYEALASLAVNESLSHIFMKDQDSFIFWPEYEYNNLTMTPGKGYQLKNTGDTPLTLTYPYLTEWAD